MNEFLQRFTVGKRLFAGFGFLLVLMTVIAISAALSLSTLERHLAALRLSLRLRGRWPPVSGLAAGGRSPRGGWLRAWPGAALDCRLS